MTTYFIFLDFWSQITLTSSIYDIKMSNICYLSTNGKLSVVDLFSLNAFYYNYSDRNSYSKSYFVDFQNLIIIAKGLQFIIPI